MDRSKSLVEARRVYVEEIYEHLSEHCPSFNNFEVSKYLRNGCSLDPTDIKFIEGAIVPYLSRNRFLSFGKITKEHLLETICSESDS